MVTDDVWAKAGMTPDLFGYEDENKDGAIVDYGNARRNDDGSLTFFPHEYLCIGCLEKRLGRKLTAEDFTDVPVNNQPWQQTRRLQKRLNRHQAPGPAALPGQSGASLPLPGRPRDSDGTAGSAAGGN